MGLPVDSDLKTLDISYLGEPFCQVLAKEGTDPNTLDLSYLGQPFWVVMVGTNTQYYRLQVGESQVVKAYLGDVEVVGMYLGNRPLLR